MANCSIRFGGERQGHSASKIEQLFGLQRDPAHPSSKGRTIYCNVEAQQAMATNPPATMRVVGLEKKYYQDEGSCQVSRVWQRKKDMFEYVCVQKLPITACGVLVGIAHCPGCCLV